MKDIYSLCQVLFFSFFTLALTGQNSADSSVNLSLLNDASVTGNLANGRGLPRDILFDPAIGNYAEVTGYAEYGVTYAENLGLVTKGNGLNWQVEWPTSKNINYITFGGTYSNQPQPNTSWAISYYNGGTWVILDQGTGGWVDSGTYEWGGGDQQPINTTKVLLEIYSDGVHDLVSIHLRGRGGVAQVRDDSANPIKACLIQFLPPSGSDTSSPTAPTLVSTGNSSSTVDLSWSNATDNSWVSGYKIFKNGILEATLGNITSIEITGLTMDTAYNFTVRSLDASGNESNVSNSVSVTTGSGSDAIWTETNSVASYGGIVRIGETIVPSGYKLAVDGKLITEEVKVQPSGNWPDYVFEDGYELPTLEEIREHIEKEGHLPNIPSAGEVEANGIELGDMNLMLLKKIEELTLYILSQEIRMSKMEEIIKEKL